MLVCRMDGNCEELVRFEAFVEFGWTETGGDSDSLVFAMPFGICVWVVWCIGAEVGFGFGFGFGLGVRIGLGLVWVMVHGVWVWVWVWCSWGG